MRTVSNSNSGSNSHTASFGHGHQKRQRLALIDTVPAPIRAYKTDWHTNQWSRGTWSSYTLGSKCTNTLDIATPMADKLIIKPPHHATSFSRAMVYCTEKSMVWH